MLNERKEHLMAQKVQVALVFQQMLGTADAHAYLSCNDVPEAVILRVLYHPDARRNLTSRELVALIEEMS